MGITTRSGYSTEANDPTPSTDNGDLWAFINHPERWQETFYTNFVDSDEEEDEMIGDEKLAVAAGDNESESITSAMEIDDEMKDGDGVVEGRKLNEKNEGPTEDDDEADEAFAVNISNPDFNTIDAEFEVSAAFVKDVETEVDCLRSNPADFGSGVGETDDEGSDNPQSNSEDDKAQVESLDPSTGKEKGKITCTCSHCGESGHSRTICKKLHLRPKYNCTRCKKKGHSKKTCPVENPGTPVGQSSFLCTHREDKGQGRQACQKLHLPPNYTCPGCGEKGHSRAICLKEKPGYVRKVIAKKKPTCSRCGRYGHDRTGLRELHQPPKFVCPRCGEKGHAHKRCRKIGESRKYAYSCSKCGEDGHNSNTCPILEKKRRHRCTYCNEEGHMRKTCPSRPCIHYQGTDHRPNSCPP